VNGAGEVELEWCARGLLKLSSKVALLITMNVLADVLVDNATLKAQLMNKVGEHSTWLFGGGGGSWEGVGMVGVVGVVLCSCASCRGQVYGLLYGLIIVGGCMMCWQMSWWRTQHSRHSS
jgi:hypothetical protein